MVAVLEVTELVLLVVVVEVSVAVSVELLVVVLVSVVSSVVSGRGLVVFSSRELLELPSANVVHGSQVLFRLLVLVLPRKEVLGL